MKKITLSLLALLSAIVIIAQSPQTFKYQAVARDAGGVVLADQNVSFLINILEGSAGGTSVYAETHTALTNQFGLVNLEIGNGLIVSGVFEDISWGSNLFFLQIEMDATGGVNYQLMGTSQLLSVPYALHSETTSDTTRWQKNVDDLYYMNGKVGIGTTTPLYNMEIHSTHNGVSRLRLSNLDYSKSLFFGSGSETHSPAIYFEGSDALRFMRYESGVGYSELMRIQADGNIGVGTNAPDPSALVEMNSTSKGFLPPRMTGEQMMALSNPIEGLVIYNYDLKSICWYDGEKWMYNGGTVSCVPFSYAGETYQTVLIGAQCWMADNLNIGDHLLVAIEQTDNNTIEKYCYNDLESNCDAYGGLYQWDEMMEYNAIEGNQGICPPGWHLPTDAEWCILTQAIDPTVDCDGNGYTGTDAGTKMKSNTGWGAGNGTNESGFTALPSGYLYGNGNFLGLGTSAYFWSTTEYESTDVWGRALTSSNSSVWRSSYDKDGGFSVRCLHGEYTPINNPPNQPTNPSPGDGSIDIGLNTTLSWACTDPDGDPLTYDVYFGTASPPPLMVSGQSETTYDPGALANELVYYWKIVAHDDNSNFTEGEVWSYTTIPQSFACGDILIDSRDSKSYATVLIGLQCWMAENLNIGIRIDGIVDQVDNSPNILEKYCYDDLESNCDQYGGLYQWNEMMDYTTTEGTQGICPEGWHIPEDNEWCILTQFIDPTVVCNGTTSGTDIGIKMKSTTGWFSSGNGNDLFGFNALPGGQREIFGSFDELTREANFWTSTAYGGDQGANRGLTYSFNSIKQSASPYNHGLSVRCIKD